MKSLVLLFTLGIVLVGIAVRGQDDPARTADQSPFDAPKVRPMTPSPPYGEKDFDYWKPRLQPPFTEVERREAIMGVGRLINSLLGRPGWKDWVTSTVVPPMSQLLRDKNANIRADSARLFSTFIHEMGKETIPTLTQLLRDSDKSVRRAAAEALGTMGPAAEVSVPAIARAASDDPSLALIAAESLQRLGPAGTDALLAMFDDASDEVRSAAASSTGVTGHLSPEQKRRVLPKLIKLLRDPSPRVRAAAVSEVPATAESSPVMIELLHDKDAQVRGQAARCVPAVREALPGVIALLKDENPTVRWYAKLKLTQMTGVVTPLPPDILNLADDPDTGVRFNLAMSLRKGGPETMPVLLKLLEDKYSSARGAAAESLGAIGRPDTKAIIALKRHLTDHGGAYIHGDEGPLVCHWAAKALNRILGDKDYLEGLPPIPEDGK